MSEYSTAYGLLQFKGCDEIEADINELMADKIYNIVNIVDAERPLKKGEYWFSTNGCENYEPFKTHISTIPKRLMDNPSLASAMEHLEFRIIFTYLEEKQDAGFLCSGKIGFHHKKGDEITKMQPFEVLPDYFNYDVYGYYQCERHYDYLLEKELKPDDINAFKDWLDACNPCIDGYLQKQGWITMISDCLPTLKSAKVPFIKGYILALADFLSQHTKYTKKQILLFLKELKNIPSYR